MRPAPGLIGPEEIGADDVVAVERHVGVSRRGHPHRQCLLAAHVGGKRVRVARRHDLLKDAPDRVLVLALGRSDDHDNFNKLAAFRQARAALAASGTVTLELALAQVPTVAAYRGAGWEAALARRLIKLPSVILPNLIIGESVVPEFIQDDASPQALANALLAATADGPARQRQLDGFVKVEQSMRSAGPSPAANAVDAALALVREPAGG